MEKRTITKPRGLRRGDLIGIISPAGPVKRRELEEGIRMIESSGFDVFIGPNTFNEKGYLAGEDEERLSDLHAMFSHGGIKAILCARGGYGSLRLLDKIDYDLIEKNGKIFVGYSDITALLMAFYCKTGLRTFHGPVVRGLSLETKDHLDTLFQILSPRQGLEIPLSDGRVLKPGKAKGPLIGGNLSILTHLVGTDYLPSLDGSLLFIEDTAEPLYRIDRMLTHLKLSGCLKRLSGLVVGRFDRCCEMSAIESLLLDKVGDQDIVMASGLPVGHGAKNSTLPIGAMAELDTDRRTLSIMEECVTSHEPI
ncbi:MAG: LD-carboxypeptidase [Thermodesulfobacteriota bacterium]|nr:LD-carboxypeptidase [Thermodesulfobacteriota bacterium]